MPLRLLSLGTSGGGGGDGGVTTAAAIGSSPNANGMTISGVTINLEPANGSFGGVLTTGAQTIAGVKTLSSAPILSALTASKLVLTDGSKALTSGSFTESDLVLTSTNQTVGGIKTFSSAPIFSALTAQKIPYLNASKVLTDGTLTQADSTGAVTHTPTGSPTNVFDLSYSGLSSFSVCINLAATYPTSTSTGLMVGMTGSSGTSINHVGGRISIAGGSYTTSNCVALSISCDTTNTGATLGGNSGGASGNQGIFSECRNLSTAGYGQGIKAIAYAGKVNVGGNFHGVSAGSVAGNATYGVRALSTGENSAQTVGVYGIISPTDTSAIEDRNPGQSAAAIFDNTTTTSDILTLLDNGTERFVVEDGGTVDMSGIAAGTPNLRITATSDTPTVTWGAAAGNEASTTPAGYIEISVGGNARYIPFWA